MTPKDDKRKAAQAIARFMVPHPHSVAQKTEVMLARFGTLTTHRTGNRAKAMVATSSRLYAVRYQQEFDKQIREKGYAAIESLVAFSGTVEEAASVA